jgi:hypothetical protein
MRIVFRALFVVVLTGVSFAQSPPPDKWVTGTITDVKQHSDSKGQPVDPPRWDVSIKVRDTIYVVLFVPPSGHSGVQYRRGMDLNVLVGEESITYNDSLGRTRQAPIVSKRTASAAPTT